MIKALSRLTSALAVVASTGATDNIDLWDEYQPAQPYSQTAYNVDKDCALDIVSDFTGSTARFLVSEYEDNLSAIFANNNGLNIFILLNGTETQPIVSLEWIEASKPDSMNHLNLRGITFDNVPRAFFNSANNFGAQLPEVPETIDLELRLRECIPKPAIH